MGHRKYSAPRRGSLAYLPRGRASHWAPRIRFWPDYEGPPRLLGFAGFKAGTTHVTVIDNRQGSLNYGKEVTFPVTVVETPPLRVTALRFYETLNGGLRTLGEVWSNDQTKDLRRLIKTPEKFDDVKAWEKLQPSSSKLSEVRVVVASQPRTTTIGRKIPDLFEVKLDGGTVQEQLEFGKQILKMGNNGADVTPKGGFLRYGPVKTEYTVLRGTIPGPARRLVALRYPSRGTPVRDPPKIAQLNLSSKQGV